MSHGAFHVHAPFAATGNLRDMNELARAVCSEQLSGHDIRQNGKPGAANH